MTARERQAARGIQAASSPARGPVWRALLEAQWRARLQEVTELSLAYHEAAAVTAAAPPGPPRKRKLRQLLRRAIEARRALADTDEALQPAGQRQVRPLRELRGRHPGLAADGDTGRAILPTLPAAVPACGQGRRVVQHLTWTGAGRGRRSSPSAVPGQRAEFTGLLWAWTPAAACTSR